MNDTTIEKRRFLRLDVHRKAKCRFLGGDNTQFQLFSLVDVIIDVNNLSINGACITCAGSPVAAAIRPNSRVELQIPVPDEAIAISGRVVWCESTETGMKAGIYFDQINEEISCKLLRYLTGELRFMR